MAAKKKVSKKKVSKKNSSVPQPKQYPLSNKPTEKKHRPFHAVGVLKTEQEFVTPYREGLYHNNADLGIVRNYVQILLMNPARYGFKADIDINTTDLETAGTEPATLEAAKAIIGDPTTVANPPTISS